MKWVGGTTAVLSLIFALHQLTQLVADVRERQRHIAELYKVGKNQQDVGGDESAWASFEQAAKRAEAGGQLAKLTGSLNEEQRRSHEAQAISHFSAAVATGRALPYVRRVQLAALYNFHDMDREFLRAVNDMMKNSEKVDANARSHVFGIYYFALNSNKNLQQLIAAVPAAEQIAMIRVLFYDADFDRSKVPTREASLAMLQEAAGLRDEALKTWQSVRADFPTNTYVTIRADASIKRLLQK